MSIRNRLKKLEGIKLPTKEPKYDFSDLSNEELRKAIDLIEQGVSEEAPELQEILKKVKLI